MAAVDARSPARARGRRRGLQKALVMRSELALAGRHGQRATRPHRLGTGPVSRSRRARG
jgi:hypothetical protein